MVVSKIYVSNALMKNIHKYFIYLNNGYLIFVTIIIMITLFCTTDAMAKKALSSSYTVKITSSDQATKTHTKETHILLSEFKKDLEAKTLTKEEKANLNHRFNEDLLLLDRLLKAKGFYDAKIQAALDETSKIATFAVNIGKQYYFGDVKIISLSNTEKAAAIKLPAIEKISAKPGERAIADKVTGDVNYIDQWVEENNCLFSHETIHEAKINHHTQQIQLNYIVRHGVNTSFGDITIAGLNTIDEHYLLKLLSIKKGDCFRRSSIDKAKLELRNSHILDSINAQLSKTADNAAPIPVKFVVTESKQKTIKAGLGYSTDIGFSINGGWEHRNLSTHGEKLTTEASLSSIKKVASIDYLKPFYQRDDQDLKLDAKVKKEDSKAYESKGISFGGSIERRYKHKLTAEVGARYNFEHIEDEDEIKHYSLILLPISIAQDKSNNRLNPTLGWKWRFNFTPTYNTRAAKDSYLKNWLGVNYYHSFFDSEDHLLALRGGVGSIKGDSINSIPATERFYAGGSNSLRGYGYQMVTPLDKKNHPIGGLSIIETSAELRFRIQKKYGIVPFIDCGNSYSDKIPAMNKSLFCGAGIGFRYYSAIGPLRVDYAIPLKKRAGIDKSFQLYFGIGQSF